MSDPTVPPAEPTKKPVVKKPVVKKPAVKAPAKAPAKTPVATTPAAKAPAKPRTKPAPPAEAAIEAAPVVEAAPLEAVIPAKRRVQVKLLAAILIPVVVLATVGGLAAANRQFLSDQWTVWNFEASPALADYIDDATMTDHALFLFNASKPRVAADSEFKDVCGSKEGDDGVLGCYTPKNKRIILFEISDKRLSGFQEAVAAHEMLHAAWARLSDGERKRLTTLLDAEAKRHKNDHDFQEQLDAYHFGAHDADRANELHSLIATQVPGISDELEEYYEQYFTDRGALVGLYQESHQVLVDIAKAVEALNDELEALDKKIEDDYKTYTDGYDALNADWDAFSDRNQAYFYKTQAAFDRDRNALFARGDALDALFDSIDAMTDEYNEKVDELTELDAKAAELFSSINLDPESVVTS